jgi:hypothetical protein
MASIQPPRRLARRTGSLALALAMEISANAATEMRLRFISTSVILL